MTGLCLAIHLPQPACSIFTFLFTKPIDGPMPFIARTGRSGTDPVSGFLRRSTVGLGRTPAVRRHQATAGCRLAGTGRCQPVRDGDQVCALALRFALEPQCPTTGAADHWRADRHPHPDRSRADHRRDPVAIAFTTGRLGQRAQPSSPYAKKRGPCRTDLPNRSTTRPSATGS